MKRMLLTILVALCCAGSVFASPAETDVAVPVAGGTVHGSLLVPEGKGPFPVALIIAGSGATDRNGNAGAAMHSDAYKLLAQSLATSGIATLRYDKRMIGASQIPGYKETDARFETFVDDAVAWLKMLRSDPRFNRVSVIGHSEGSIIGMLAAQRVPGLDAYVSIAGAGQNGGDVLLRQLHANPANAPILSDSDRIIRALQAGQTASVPPGPVFASLFRPDIQPYLISWFHYDPATEISKVKNRILIVQGSHDVQINVADADRLHAAAPTAKFAVIEGMNHVLRDAPADFAENIATYSQPGLPLDATFVETLSTFLKQPK